MYYPKSQIKTNLYSNGDHILTTTQKPYTGPYYEVSNGDKYTGKSPQDKPNIKLTLTPFSPLPNDKDPIPENDIVFSIEDPSYTIQNVPPRKLPNPSVTLPTDQDKQNGQFIRYFCTKNNELRYFEIDKLTYDKLSNKDKQIAWDLYSPASLTWRIKGNKEQVFNSNKGAAISLERNLKWVGFPQYFQDKFLKYYLES